MPKTKVIEVVTIYIVENYFVKETDSYLMFRPIKQSDKSRIYFSKKYIYNFEKVITWFPHWKGRRQEKAFKFQIPLWLYREKESILNTLLDRIIVINTHKF